MTILCILIGLQFLLSFFISMYLGFTMDNLNATNKEIEKLRETLSNLSSSHDKNIQATRATNDKLVELAEKIENVDEEVLNVDRKFSEFDERIEEIATKLETIGSTFRSLGTDLE